MSETTQHRHLRSQFHCRPRLQCDGLKKLELRGRTDGVREAVGYAPHAPHLKVKSFRESNFDSPCGNVAWYCLVPFYFYSENLQ